MYIKTLLLQVSPKRPPWKGEHQLEAEELMLTCHCRGESKNLSDQRNTARSSDLLWAIGCPREVGGKESEERSKRRQKRTRNG